MYAIICIRQRCLLVYFGLTLPFENFKFLSVAPVFASSSIRVSPFRSFPFPISICPGVMSRWRANGRIPSSIRGRDDGQASAWFIFRFGSAGTEAEMTPIEQLFKIIFDRKCRIESQLRQQEESYAESLAYSLLADGKQPPPWLLESQNGNSLFIYRFFCVCMWVVGCGWWMGGGGGGKLSNLGWYQMPWEEV